ncbi:hypothetical protein AGLY_014696 [Aphis glycines]|uniref:Uncharacterized protein n=1 Tax=Aphis glycines TaxID=307491 RepID=A0A6G0T1Y1_APHGL|nr:hypothetical protein AGLY_014696 [Aphis glycines]
MYCKCLYSIIMGGFEINRRIICSNSLLINFKHLNVMVFRSILKINITFSYPKFSLCRQMPYTIAISFNKISPTGICDDITDPFTEQHVISSINCKNCSRMTFCDMCTYQRISRSTHIEPGLPSKFVLGEIIKVPRLMGRGDTDSCLSICFRPIIGDGLNLSERRSTWHTYERYSLVYIFGGIKKFLGLSRSASFLTLSNSYLSELQDKNYVKTFEKLLKFVFVMLSAFLDLSPSADITFPNANKPQLIDIPSLALSPVAPVRFNLSEPANYRIIIGARGMMPMADGSVSSIFSKSKPVPIVNYLFTWPYARTVALYPCKAPATRLDAQRHIRLNIGKQTTVILNTQCTFEVGQQQLIPVHYCNA